MGNTNYSGPVFLVMTGFTCNNDCLMCSVKPKGLINKPRNTEQIIADMQDGKKQGYQRIEFTGGEPTVRRDFLTLVNKAKELGFQEIAISTNCRTLHNLEFLKSLQKAGLNRITTTLYGNDVKSHENVTRTPGSFKQTTQGITNSLSQGITISVNTVVFNLTVKNLKKIGEYLISLGVHYWTLLDLIPDGYAIDIYNSLSINPNQLKSSFKKIEPLFDKFNSVQFMDFPYCIFPPQFMINPHSSLVNAKGRTEIIKQVGYQPKRFKEKNDIFFDFHKIRSKKCRQCAYNNDCGGSWITYFYLYGDSFIKPFPKKISAKND